MNIDKTNELYIVIEHYLRLNPTYTLNCTYSTELTSLRSALMISILKSTSFKEKPYKYHSFLQI